MQKKIDSVYIIICGRDGMYHFTCFTYEYARITFLHCPVECYLLLDGSRLNIRVTCIYKRRTYRNKKHRIKNFAFCQGYLPTYF